MSDELKRAVRYSYRLLSYRDRSEAELKQRLGRKDFSPEVADIAVARLREAGYLDDSQMAANLVRRAGEVKHLGLHGARHYLVKMGIPREMAEEALSGYDEYQSARRLLENKLRFVGGLPPLVARRRLLGYLSRRGYSAEVVRKSLEPILKETRR